MQLLYVVEFRVDHAHGSGAPAEVYQRVLTHLVAWQTHDHPDALTLNMLSIPGEAVLGGADEVGIRRLDWTIEGTEATRAMQLRVRTNIRESGTADFVCAVTTYIDEQRVMVRIEMGREVAGGVLAPAGNKFLRRPHLMVLLTRDPDLVLWAGPNRVDGRFSWVNARDADDLWNDLNRPDRQLPVLLVDAGGDVGDSLAWRCAGELAGLASVRAVDGRAQARLKVRLESIAAPIPPGGAVLIWPDVALRHPGFAENLAHSLPVRLLRTLSSVSVPARGANELMRRAAAARRVARDQQLEAQLQDAYTKGDLESQLAAQAARIAELRALEDQWVEDVERLEAERDEFRTQAAMATYWKQQAEAAWSASGSQPESLEDAPALEPGNLDDLAAFLEEHSDGAIVFTAAATRSWKKDKYPHVSSMQDALLRLTRAAMEYRRLECQLAMLADDWFKQVWELSMSGTDGYMAQQGMDKFNFQGTQYNRQPHLKLDDFVSPNEVGRVYFAMDADGRRFIVDHVGLKLYGL